MCMAPSVRENDTFPSDLDDTSPLPPEQDRGIDPQAGPVTRLTRNRMRILQYY